MPQSFDSHHSTELEIQFLRDLPKIHASRLRRVTHYYSPNEHLLHHECSDDELYGNYLDAMDLRKHWENLDSGLIRKACVQLWNKSK